MNLAILSSHLFFFALAMTFPHPRRSLGNDIITFVTGAVCFPVFAVIVLAMLDFSNHAGNGTTGAWYLIYSVVTLGAVPLVTHLCAIVSGRCASRSLQIVRAWRRSRRGVTPSGFGEMRA